ncbi:Fc receptor-like protein 6 [Sminthopsis crassicaudata]|uniref:Fc receptor-like protein 6 n=1 Tax=Sminthopsis crassicaudata TaxID=9301 RepID=UPI003D692DE4
MLLKVALLLLALVIGKFDVITKPILSLQPPWTTFFFYEKVNLTCEHLDLIGLGNIQWYKQEKKFHKTSTNTIIIRESGQYSCGNEDSVHSDPVTITFLKEWLILQTPYSVFEGDTMILQCQGWKKFKLSRVTFYKWKKSIYFTEENKALSIKAARREDSGQYSCSAYVENQKKEQRSTLVILQVQDLFPRPKLRIKNSTEAMVGSSVNLSCETQLSPQRSASRLYFSFYKDNRTIRGRDRSPEYCIPATIIAGTGFYWCVAATEDDQVQKQSLELEIQGSTSIPLRHRRSQLVLGILVLFVMTGISAAFLLYFRVLKKAEGAATPDPARGAFFPGTPETPKAASSPNLESCPVYVNVNPLDEKNEDMVYSEVFFREQKKKAISKHPSPREDDFSVIYSKVRLPQSQKLTCIRE